MDLNVFFRQATLRICSSLNLHQAMEKTLAYLKNYIPADGFFLGLYDPELNIGRRLVSIVPESWPSHADNADTMLFSEEYREQFTKDWGSEPLSIVINDVDQVVEPARRMLLQRLSPQPVSVLRRHLFLDSKKIGAVILAAAGKHRYRDEHAALLDLLNEPFSIAIANYLQHQETVRLKEMLSDDNRYLQRELIHISGDDIIGANFGLKDVMGQIRQVAPLDSPVLLLGETGVGKEVLANAIHNSSPRRKGPLIKVNCGGLPESLLNSELFGHEKGAFTGAIAKKRGRFERANKGTIFLDEIGELPHAAQVKMLRVLQNQEIERVGGSQTIPVDIRIISATHRNLEEMIQQGDFREDLWFRLNVFPIMIPPLRQRPQDIPELIDYFISRKAREMKISTPFRLAPGTLEMLTSYRWPGNVRELENIVERAIIQSRGNRSELLSFDLPLSGKSHACVNNFKGQASDIQPLDDVIATHIRGALEKTGGKIEGPGCAAELLQLHPSTLRGKMRKLGIRIKK